MIEIINLLFNLIQFLLIARIILSWFPHNRFHPIIKIVYNFTDPLLGPFRNMINPIGGIDLSPIIVFFLLRLLRDSLIHFLI
jgi:YggT family protein|tara:strand:- start:18546 stop:18791 length:246 start_codon:yes stop_codon:yes gene_type:complete